MCIIKFIVLNKRELKFQTLGDVIRYFRNKHLAQIVMFVYNCAEDGLEIEATLSKLGLAS